MQTLAESPRRPALRLGWAVPLLPAAVSGFCFSALLYYHVQFQGAVDADGIAQSLVVGLYRVLGFVPAMMLAMLAFVWSTMWYVAGEIDRPWRRTVRLLAFAVALSILLGLQPGDGGEGGGILGGFVAARLEAVVGYVVGTMVVALAVMFSLLLATDMMFYRHFEALARIADGRQTRQPEDGVEVEAVQDMKDLRLEAAFGDGLTGLEEHEVRAPGVTEYANVWALDEDHAGVQVLDREAPPSRGQVDAFDGDEDERPRFAPEVATTPRVTQRPARRSWRERLAEREEIDEDEHEEIAEEEASVTLEEDLGGADDDSFEMGQIASIIDDGLSDAEAPAHAAGQVSAALDLDEDDDFDAPVSGVVLPAGIALADDLDDDEAEEGEADEEIELAADEDLEDEQADEFDTVPERAFDFSDEDEDFVEGEDEDELDDDSDDVVLTEDEDDSEAVEDGDVGPRVAAFELTYADADDDDASEPEALAMRPVSDADYEAEFAKLLAEEGGDEASADQDEGDDLEFDYEGEYDDSVESAADELDDDADLDEAPVIEIPRPQPEDRSGTRQRTLFPAAQEDLIAEAVEVVRAAGRASVTFLQRRLRIGYDEAAEVLEQLRGIGVVDGERGELQGHVRSDVE